MKCTAKQQIANFFFALKTYAFISVECRSETIQESVQLYMQSVHILLIGTSNKRSEIPKEQLDFVI